MVETVVHRIPLTSRLCIVSLSLLETLVSLHLEDVLLTLVLRHLLPCTFLLPSHRHRLHTSDPHGRAAYKLLALVPVSCDPPVTPVTPRRRPSTAMTPQVPHPPICHCWLDGALVVVKQ